MKVLILGAGASKPACYPVAKELMLTIEADAKASRDSMLTSAWEHWERTKKAAPGALRLLLDDPNPEVVLSVLDLCAMSRDVSDLEIVPPENRVEFVGHILSDTEVPDDRFASLDHKWLANAAGYRPNRAANDTLGGCDKRRSSLTIARCESTTNPAQSMDASTSRDDVFSG